MPALVVCPEAPYPLTGGGPMRTASLIEYLAARTEVDLVVFREPGSPDPAAAIPPGLVRSVSVVDLPYHAQTVPARAMRNLRRLLRAAPPLIDRFAGFENELDAAIPAGRYDLCVLEHFWLAPYWHVAARRSDRVVLDLHNIESEWHRSLAAIEPPPVAASLRRFAKSCLALEYYWLPRFDEVLVTGLPDADRVRSIAPGVSVRLYPNTIPCMDLPCATRSDAVIFSGNLEYRPNRHAVRFFREQVWKGLRRQPGLEWWIAGKNSAALGALLRGDERIRRVELGPRAIDHLARARIAVVPLFAGSGTRIKVIEAWAAGLAVVSTALGIEGLPAREGFNFRMANTGPEFLQVLTELIDCPEHIDRLARGGRLTYERELTWNAAWRALEGWF